MDRLCLNTAYNIHGDVISSNLYIHGVGVADVICVNTQWPTDLLGLCKICRFF
jgi:hypothetical protein